MAAYSKNNDSQRSLSLTIAHFCLLLAFLWAFLGTIDGPAVNLGIDAGPFVSRAFKLLDRESGVQLAPLWIGVFPREPLPVHASFLVFDFKQNLRRWPNVFGDISRSPPLFLDKSASLQVF